MTEEESDVIWAEFYHRDIMGHIESVIDLEGGTGKVRRLGAFMFVAGYMQALRQHHQLTLRDMAECAREGAKSYKTIFMDRVA